MSLTLPFVNAEGGVAVAAVTVKSLLFITMDALSLTPGVTKPNIMPLALVLRTFIVLLLITAEERLYWES